MIRPVSGVSGAGFRMIGAPAAIAGATLWAHWFSGELNGVIHPAQRLSGSSG